MGKAFEFPGEKSNGFREKTKLIVIGGEEW